jgi:hypothetical protein
MSETANREDVKNLVLRVEEEEFQVFLRGCRLEQNQEFSKEEQDLLCRYKQLLGEASQEEKDEYEKALQEDKTPQQALDEMASRPLKEESAEANEPEADLEGDSAGETEAAEGDAAEETEAAEGEDPAGSNGKKIRKRRKPISLFDLMKEGQKLTGKPITLARGQEFLAACGLPEKMEYSGEEGTRFLQACDRVVNQGQSLAEVARENGVDTSARQSPFDWARQQGSDQTEELDRLAEQNAQLDDQVKEVYQQSYLGRVQQYFKSGEYDRRYAAAKARLRQERGPTPFEQFEVQYRLWKAQQDPLARIQEGTPDNPRLIEEDKGV